MSMDKCSAEGKVCTYCGKDALPGTDPAVCQDHLLTKEASEEKEIDTLKKLEAQD